MIVNERHRSYINSLARDNSELLQKIEQEALEHQVPIIKKETQCLLKTLLTLQKPRAILEVGTAVGFSALLIREANPVDCIITTIENYDKRIPIAKANFKRAKATDGITLLEGDANQILLTLDHHYDMVFVDAAKGQYINFLPKIMPLLSEGGLLISDNVLQDGDLIESRFAVTRRNRTIHKRMRDYLYEITHREDLETTILTVGDGVAVSVKKGLL